MTHEEARDAIPLLVVDADDPSMRTALFAHIEACDMCRQALREHRLAADAIGRGVPQIKPRPELRERILTSIREASAEEPRGRSPARAVWPHWTAAAAAVVALASVAALIAARAEITRLRETLAISQARLAQAEQSSTTLRAELVANQQTHAILASGDLQRVPLSGIAPADRAGATAFISRTRRALVFNAHDLPPLPPDRVYQVWAIADGAPISAGIFTADATGRAQLVADLPTLSGTLAAIAVTVEPHGGVPSPTGPKYLVGTPAN
jgi:anti-sigma-K factor RskA